MKHQQPIVNQFLESEQDFSYDINNRNLCFGGSSSGGKGIQFDGPNTNQDMFTVNPKLRINQEQFRDGTFEDFNKALTDFVPGIVREYGNLVEKIIPPTPEGDQGYGQTQDDTTDDSTPEEDLPTETTMTAEEKRNKLRQLMASRYGRRETILTGGTGLSDFGV